LKRTHLRMEWKGENDLAKILPVKYPPVDNMARNAFLLSVITNYPEMRGWIYSNYIQLVAGGNFSIDFVSNNVDHIRYRWLDSSHMKRDFVKKWIPSIKEFIIDCIDNDYYVHSIVNERFIPPSPAYMKKDFVHNILVFGYDDASFYVGGYFNNPPKFALDRKVSFSDFEQAFIHSDSEHLEKTWQFELFKTTGSRLDKYKKNFDMELVLESIAAYVNSTPQFPARMNSNIEKDLAFGLRIHDRTMENLSGLGHPYLFNTRDLRSFQAQCNHKFMMIERINFMGAEGYLRNCEKISERYKEIYELSMTIRNGLIKYNITQKHELLDRAVNDTEKLKVAEKEVLEHLLDNIEMNEQ